MSAVARATLMAVIVMAAALAAAAPHGAAPAAALTVTAPPACVVELTAPLTTWTQAGCGTATTDQPGVPVTSSITNTTALPVGVTVVTWTATNSGETAHDRQAVLVADTARPTLGVPAAHVVEATGPTTPPGTSFGKATGLLATGHVSATCDVPAPLPVGITRITCIASDPAGNAASATWAAVVRDTTPPTVTPPPTATVEATAFLTPLSSINPGKATATDLATTSPDITSTTTSGLRLGANTVVWTATDGEGNSASTTQTVTVVDTTGPSITAPADIVYIAPSPVSRSALGNQGFPTVADLADLRPTVTNNNPESFGFGNTTVTWIATDSSGNASTDTQIVNVRNGTSPRTTVNTTIPFTILPSPDYHVEEAVPLTNELLVLYENDYDPLISHIFIYNTTSRSKMMNFSSSHYYRSLTPIQNSEDDTRFAVMCTSCSPTRYSVVQIFDHNLTGPIATINKPADVFGYLGFSMASSGDKLFVSASNFVHNNLSNVGHVLVYNTTNWQLLYKIANPEPLSHDSFGYRISLHSSSDDTSSDTVYALSRRHTPTLHMYSSDWEFPSGLIIGELQAFNATSGELLDTAYSPWNDLLSRFGFALEASDNGAFHCRSVSIPRTA